MSTTTLKSLILLSFFIYAHHHLFPKVEGCFIKFFKVHVDIVNLIPDTSTGPILVHCSSKDDDLGNHTLTSNQSWGFDFCLKPFSTLFACRIQWGPDQVGFVAYDGKWILTPCEGAKHCTWRVDDVGVHPSRGSKFYGWQH